MPNRLANETSPYLLQHAHNPVDWFPWGPEALERAKREDKPIFLSIGYAACHWCHVMERESFEDAATAEDLNRDFVAVKVDREERPDLDQVYMAAVQAMTGGGGWPMSVFLTPDGKPFYGGTYFPPQPAHGMPAFRQVLAGIARAWREDRLEVVKAGSTLVGGLVEQSRRSAGSAAPTREVLDQATAEIERQFDARNGGWGSAP
ncbi:MAG TPA: thioredoxin domain-containing protein, partial [Candidatus Limnocylindrales bacterium]|nr:thioredoxin domain-containing protein [Candidatus Limnocylindrales bacterium]